MKKAMKDLKNSQKRVAKNEDHCLDCDKTTRISESEAYEITKRIMKGKPVTVLQKMDLDVQKKVLSRLKNDGLILR